MKNTFNYLIALLFIFTSCTAQETKTVLTADEFEKEIGNASAQILDVCTTGEFNGGHIANALHADWNSRDEFTRRISFIDKKKPVYVYCLAGGRSRAAAESMRSAGFEKVYELGGGINAWKAGDKKLDGATTEAQMSVDAYNNTIAGSKIVLVDFGAPWCPPCKQMEPIVQNTQKKYEGKVTLLKVDGGKDQDLVQLHNVTALPVFIVYKDGKEVWRKDGVATQEELDKVLGN